MDSMDKIPVSIAHVSKGPVPQDTSIIDKYVNPSVVINGRLDNLITILDRVVISNSLSA